MNLYEKFADKQFKVVGTKKLIWEGTHQYFKVVKVNIDNLKYNVLNGRIAELDLHNEIELNEARYNDIKMSIITQSRKDIEILAKDIARSKLKEPLIINKDGVIIDGNRRYTAINMLLDGEIKPQFSTDIVNLEFVEVVILNASSEDKAIKLLEYSLQYDDKKKPYDPISRAFDFTRSHEERGLSVDEISESTGIKKSEIEKDIRSVKLIRAYLNQISHKNDIELAILLKLDGPIKEIAGSAEKTNYFLNNPKLLVDIITLVKQQGEDSTRSMRELVNGFGSGKKRENITNSPRIKESFEKIAKEAKIEEIVIKAAEANNREERVKIISESKPDQKNSISAHFSNLKKGLLEEQLPIQYSSKIEAFKIFVLDLDPYKLNNESKKLLKEINERINSIVQ